MIDINNLGDMDIENMTSEEKKELLDAIVERASKIVWKQQYLILKEGDKEIYRFGMLFINEALNESFFDNLNLTVDWDKWELKETEVDFNEEEAKDMTYGETADNAKIVDYSFVNPILNNWIDQWNRTINQ